MRDFEIKPELESKLIRLSRKDKPLYERLLKKIDEVVASEEIEHYKNLRYDMRDSQRVHIGHFVLVFSYNPLRDFVSFEDFEHHDKIYRNG